MKKMMGVIAILALILGFAFLQSNKDSATEPDELPHVGILQLTSHPALDSINQGIMDALEEEGFIEGETMTLDFQNAQGDQSNLNAMSAQFVSKEADVMVGIATPAAQALANASSEIPIILGAVTDPEGAGLVETNEQPNTNVTGVSDVTPIQEQFDLIQTILPDAKTIGLIYSSNEDNSIVQGETAKEIAEAMGYNVVVSTIASTNDVSQVAAVLASQVDAIWVPTDNAIASAMNTLISETDKQTIPVFPAVDTMVEQGGLATIGLDQYELGKMTGKMAAEVLKGEIKPETEPIRYLTEGTVFLNEEKATQLNLVIPESVRERTEKKE